MLELIKTCDEPLTFELHDGSKITKDVQKTITSHGKTVLCLPSNSLNREYFTIPEDVHEHDKFVMNKGHVDRKKKSTEPTEKPFIIREWLEGKEVETFDNLEKVAKERYEQSKVEETKDERNQLIQKLKDLGITTEEINQLMEDAKKEEEA